MNEGSWVWAETGDWRLETGSPIAHVPSLMTDWRLESGGVGTGDLEPKPVMCHLWDWRLESGEWEPETGSPSLCGPQWTV